MYHPGGSGVLGFGRGVRGIWICGVGPSGRGTNVLTGSPFQAIIGATCLRSPLDRVAIPVCYTASANANFQVVLTRKKYESIGGVGWGGTTGLSAEADGCKGRHLVTCRASVSVTRPELLTIVPGRQRNPTYVTAMAYVYMDVARPPVPTEPLQVTPPSGTLLVELKNASAPPAPESTWISEILLIHRAERLPTFRLPTNFYRIDSADQLFLLINLERTTRGLVPYFGLSEGAPYLGAIIQGGGPRLTAGALDIAEAGVSDPARAVFQWLYNKMTQPMPACSRADPGACSVVRTWCYNTTTGLPECSTPSLGTSPAQMRAARLCA